LYSQDTKTQRNWSLTGYIKDLQLAYYKDPAGIWLLNNELHNRIDFRWYPSKSLNLHIGMRNRLVYGNFVGVYQSVYAALIAKDYGYLDMTRLIANDSSYLAVSNIDRANIRYTTGKFEVTVGRQRVNWGIGFIWTPNDIFNSFSYFDFDYEERPGSDAVKLEYYTGTTASVQVVGSLNSNKRPTIAGMYRFNKWEYDLQFLAGMMVNDLVVGGGWAGQIKGAGFRGEISYFIPADHPMDSTGQLEATVDADYTLKDGLYLHAAVLYNSTGTTGPAGGYNYLINTNISVKDFTLARYSLFAEVAYPITPLIRADASAIFNPSDKSVFAGPSVDISLSNNWHLLLLSQLFYGDTGTEFGGFGKIWYARLKWSF
jgi:hypothetical protein